MHWSWKKFFLNLVRHSVLVVCVYYLTQASAYPVGRFVEDLLNLQGGGSFWDPAPFDGFFLSWPFWTMLLFGVFGDRRWRYWFIGVMLLPFVAVGLMDGLWAIVLFGIMLVFARTLVFLIHKIFRVFFKSADSFI